MVASRTVTEASFEAEMAVPRSWVLRPNHAKGAALQTLVDTITQGDA
jgi:hypothetical protein